MHCLWVIKVPWSNSHTPKNCRSSMGRLCMCECVSKHTWQIWIVSLSMFFTTRSRTHRTLHTYFQEVNCSERLFSPSRHKPDSFACALRVRFGVVFLTGSCCRNVCIRLSSVSKTGSCRQLILGIPFPRQLPNRYTVPAKDINECVFEGPDLYLQCPLPSGQN